MKKITKLEVQKKNKDRVNVYLDGTFAFGADISIVGEYGLFKGKEIDDEYLQDVIAADEKQKAWNYALSFLSGRARTESEMKQRLSDKGYDDDISNGTILRLKSCGYIDDDDFSERFIRDRLALSKDGRLKIKQALYQKGVDRQTIEDKLGEVSDDDEFDRALAVAYKKLRSISETDIFKKKRKLYSYLLGRGFDYDISSRAASEALSCDDE